MGKGHDSPTNVVPARRKDSGFDFVVVFVVFWGKDLVSRPNRTLKTLI